MSTRPAGSETVPCGISAAKFAISQRYDATATQPSVVLVLPQMPAAVRMIPWNRKELAIWRVAKLSMAMARGSSTHLTGTAAAVKRVS